MKFSSILTLFALVSTGFATHAADSKECTPSFDYCGSKLLSSKGWTEDELKESLKDTDLKDDSDALDDVKNVVFHCKNPGIVGHPKYCPDGCKEAATDGNGDKC
ncbi:hypothetical protein ASPWEDRAFT_176870 [Aspergillus wentii DTO 134E9]|uniref:Uncharacterized protein n=1 Tax=Aspergillus wentii DTO 134E9 TaxID=1073089 RepID=A0A1L9R5J9_ASPWE|nr:uncharacterized protein ASPWEDRAFT_176870 [Aspergillus wentii DTO 134E9]KAI9925303.1 hypothetical protein MW887_006230 [Aspergillus wentii]OJJ30199.1 hypothetical protein ASPWEDRAFT_176870 [Aspergillus wentii DTO 134E9]